MSPFFLALLDYSLVNRFQTHDWRWTSLAVRDSQIDIAIRTLTHVTDTSDVIDKSFFNYHIAIIIIHVQTRELFTSCLLYTSPSPRD